MIKALTFEQLAAKPSYGWKQAFGQAPGLSNADLSMKLLWRPIELLYHQPIHSDQSISTGSSQHPGHLMGQGYLKHFSDWDTGNGSGTFSSLDARSLRVQFDEHSYHFVGKRPRKHPFCLNELLHHCCEDGITLYWSSEVINRYFSYWHHPDEDLKELYKHHPIYF
jgi:hypothetical protein